MTKNFIPAISVIIPMYNAEKYISECLESIFAQTFQDFEVIVVDDCSTDNSVQVVETYRKFFGDKLKLLHTKKNSGSPGEPSNIGVRISRGEYIFFMDNDDAITKTALEELYFSAKNFSVDVLTLEKYFCVETDQNLLGRNDYKLTYYNAKNFVTEPTLISENFVDRVRDLQAGKFIWNLWSKLIRRDFFLENNIQHLDCIGEDAICTICLICSAKRFLRLPNVVNIYRVRNTSISNSKKSQQEILKNSIKSFVQGTAYLDNFLMRQEFFKNNPEAKFLVIDVWTKMNAENWLEPYREGSVGNFDDLLFAELNKIENKNSCAAFLFNRMNFFDVLWDRDLQKTKFLENKIQELQNKIFILENQ